MKSEKRKSSCLYMALMLLLGFSFVICVSITVYQPDRPVDRIEPGSSTGPAFVVQVIRPRAGLPLGGLLPPELFNVDAHLGFNSDTEGATFSIPDGRIELSAKEWVLKLAFDADGQVASDSEVTFSLIFEEQRRTVRCRPGNPAVGAVTFIELSGSREISGHFDVELTHCEDAETGEPLGWPPKPFILRGSFDRLKPNE